MFRRYFVISCMAVILLLFASCEKKPETLTEQSDGTFLWSDLQLIREDSGWYERGTANVEVSVLENVITTKEKTLTMSFKSMGGDFEFGVKEFVQVYIDGFWYTINQQLSQYNETLILLYSQNTEYTADFSVVGELPAGQYRFVETFYEKGDPLKEEAFAFANFWVIKSGGKRPPESETTGNARKEDIVLYMQSYYEARRVITDKDIWFALYVENLSGKRYCMENEQEKNPPILEINQNGEWEKIEYQHINAGLVQGWTTDRNEIFLDKPLKAGHYRIRVPMYILYEPQNNMELEYEFEVIERKDAPEPKWEILRLIPSPYNAAEQSEGIKMTAANPVLNENNTELEITLAADNIYTYGEPYEVEVMLDGKWYCVPFANGGFIMPAYTIDPNRPEYSRTTFSCDPVLRCGILPAGQYRIIKDFDLHESSPLEGQKDVIAKEFAFVEFTVEETLSSEDYFIEMIQEAYEE